jgi:hypothetical protein
LVGWESRDQLFLLPAGFAALLVVVFFLIVCVCVTVGREESFWVHWDCMPSIRLPKGSADKRTRDTIHPPLSQVLLLAVEEGAFSPLIPPNFAKPKGYQKKKRVPPQG